MSGLTNDEKLNILFKKLYNKSSTNSYVDYYQELYNSMPTIIPDKQILTDPIPSTVPVELLNANLDDLEEPIEGSITGKTSDDTIIRKYVKYIILY